MDIEGELNQGELKHHWAADLFPQMGEREFQALKDDIEQHEQREKIVLHQGLILDSRHRYRACRELNIEPRFRSEDKIDDPTAYVLSRNAHRRHLNPSQRALVAAKLADAKWGGDRSKAQKCALTHWRAGDQLNVSERLVDQAATLLKAREEKRAVPELEQAVCEGKMRLGQATKIAKLPAERQREILSETKGQGRQSPQARQQRR